MHSASTSFPPPEPADVRTHPWELAACGAVALPVLVAYNLPPSATFLNQALALLGWGAWLALLATALPRGGMRWPSGLQALVAALGLLLLAALAAPLWTGQPWALSLSGAGLTAAAAVTALVGAALQQAGLGALAFRAFCAALLVAGVASGVIGLLQVYAPAWTDGNWIARSVTEGRAVGNLRQPNHLCSLLLWGGVATAWLTEARVIRRAAGAALALLLMFAVVLSASRSGVIGAVVLALWGALDRRLSGRVRVALLLSPLAYALLWAGAAAWAHHSQQVFEGETRFSAAGDISSSRFGIWANTLSLIRMHPWVGVGFGEFNFAWTLTPFPGRPIAFFDHAHNLPLHLATELGLPLAALVLGLLGWALWCAWRAGQAGPAGAARPPGPTDPTGRPETTTAASHLRAAFVMVLMVLVHSLLEYPLWYAYFLLPAAFALGLGVGGQAAPRAEATGPSHAATRPLLVAALLTTAGAALSIKDYARAVAIFAPDTRFVAAFAPSGPDAPLPQRISEGQRSWFFSHHGDYAAVTTADSASQAAAGLGGAPHYLLDARLMTAWARVLHEAGDEQRARHVAQRLKEFRNAQAKEFFEPCEAAALAAASAAMPAAPALFQCQMPEVPMDYRAFR